MRLSPRAILTVVVLIAALPASAAPLTSADIATALTFAEQQASKTIASLGGDYTIYPRSGVAGDGSWGLLVPASDWTSGFWPWELTSLYRATGDPYWLNNAVAWTLPLAGQAASTVDNDTGMRMQSYGALYSLTGDPGYKAVLLQAGGTLAGRYNAAVGAFNHWDFTGPGTFNLVIDSMNDLRPLTWGGANGGDPAWLTEAVQHADTIAAALIRSDGSTFQYAQYNPVTGQQTFLGTYQGYSDTSDWQRGLAWAINGYSDLYYQTKDATFLQIAEKLADHFIAVLPADCVPYWDAADPSVPNAPRDTSAGALGDLGLTKLSVLATNPSDQSRYEAAAQCGLRSLIFNGYLADDSTDAVLSQGNAPDGTNTPLIYGDGAFVTALTAQEYLDNGVSIGWTMSYDFDPFVSTDVMEPCSLLLISSGCAALAGFRRRRFGPRNARPSVISPTG